MLAVTWLLIPTAGWNHVFGKQPITASAPQINSQQENKIRKTARNSQLFAT
jgi:hypothetical protein